jgi:hypothetical protein
MPGLQPFHKLYIFLLIIAVAISYQPAFAQPQRGQFDIGVSAGRISGVDIGYIFAGDAGITNEMSATGDYFASAKYFLTNHVAVGISAGTQTIHGQSTLEYYSNPFSYNFTEPWRQSVPLSILPKPIFNSIVWQA